VTEWASEWGQDKSTSSLQAQIIIIIIFTGDSTRASYNTKTKRKNIFKSNGYAYAMHHHKSIMLMHKFLKF